MQEQDATARFFQTVTRDGRFPLEAFHFLHRALERAAQQVHGDDDGDAPRHVSGQQLCAAFRELALDMYGPLAREVLSRWRIRETRDIGEMVFLLVNAELMGAQESDSIHDFDAVYDFSDAFDQYEIPLESLPD